MEELIKNDGAYSIVKDGEHYKVKKDAEYLRTPAGVPACTVYLEIAEALLNDWKEKGYESFTEADSILSYHFTFQQNFAPLGEKKVVEILNGLNWEKEWTLQSCPSANPHVWMEWVGFFGKGPERIKQIRNWMNKATCMQLTAMTCVYNAFMSYNIAFYMGVVVEYSKVKNHKRDIRALYKFYSNFDSMYTFDEIWNIFVAFRLYYGIHFKKNGAIIV